MADLIIKNSQYVDTEYSTIVEPIFYEDDIFVEGVTYTAVHQTSAAGQIMVHKLGKGTVTVSAPGGDFESKVVADSLIPIVLDQELKQSRKLYGIVASMVGYNKLAAEFEACIKEVKEERQKTGLGFIVKEGTALAAKTMEVDTIYSELVAARKTIRDKNSVLTGFIVSTEVYGLLLELPLNKFIPSTAEDAYRSGLVGRVLGVPVYEANALNGDAKFADGTTQSLDGVNFIAMNGRAFSIVDALTVMRTVDTDPTFAGTHCQFQINSGFKVTSPDYVLVSKKA